MFPFFPSLAELHGRLYSLMEIVNWKPKGQGSRLEHRIPAYPINELNKLTDHGLVCFTNTRCALTIFFLIFLSAVYCLCLLILHSGFHHYLLPRDS